MSEQLALPSRVLVVDDDVAMGDYLVEGLSTLGFEACAVTDPELGLARLAIEPFDAVLTDLRMRGMDGLELCGKVRALHNEMPVLVLTAFADLDAAVGAVRAGAYDFLSKPVTLQALALALGRATAQRRLQRRVKSLEASLETATGFGDFVGTSPCMLHVYELINRIANSDSSVLVTGESGTGKELVARALHRRSARATGPFVAINAAALPEALLESELFGHEKGAFTDAKLSHAGLFEAANGGTLFIDELGELPLGLQAKLLRAVQERTARRVGGRRELPFDVRLVTATNRDLETLVQEKLFREDLFFRLNVLEVNLPPLRARGNDVLLLAQHFLRGFAERAGKEVLGITPEAAEQLLGYPFPGNVRELQNVIERAVALTQDTRVTALDLPAKIVEHQRGSASHATPMEFISLEENERRYILRVLEASGGNRTAAAQTLGLDRSTLWRKLERYRGALEGSSPLPQPASRAQSGR